MKKFFLSSIRFLVAAEIAVDLVVAVVKVTFDKLIFFSLFFNSL